MYENIKKVGLPTWSDADQELAKGLQTELKVRVNGLPTKIPPLRAPRVQRRPGRGRRVRAAMNQPTGGGSDDIGDISWNVPTVVLQYPSNIPGGPGHNWANGVAMATPIAHKGVVAGAKVQALTMLDILLHPEIVDKAWDYFKNVQTKEDEVQELHPRWRRAGDLAEQSDHGKVSAADEDRCTTIRRSTIRTWSSSGSSIRRCGRGPNRNESGSRSVWSSRAW